MAKKTRNDSPGFRPGRRQVDRFRSLVSPLGADAAETSTYSPSRPVGEAQDKRAPSQSESARNERRGG